MGLVEDDPNRAWPLGAAAAEQIFALVQEIGDTGQPRPTILDWTRTYTGPEAEWLVPYLAVAHPTQGLARLISNGVNRPFQARLQAWAGAQEDPELLQERLGSMLWKAIWGQK